MRPTNRVGPLPKIQVMAATSERLVHTDTAQAGEFIKMAAAYENHWVCKKFVGEVGALRAKDDFAGFCFRSFDCL